MDTITAHLESGTLSTDVALSVLEDMIQNPDNGSQWVGHAKRVRKILQNVRNFRQPTQLELALAFSSAGFAPAAFRSKIIQWSKNPAFCGQEEQGDPIENRKYGNYLSPILKLK